jgi:hypothetical protein
MTLGFVQELEQPEPKTRVETYQSFMHELEQPESSTKVESWDLRSFFMKNWFALVLY